MMVQAALQPVVLRPPELVIQAVSDPWRLGLQLHSEMLTSIQTKSPQLLSQIAVDDEHLAQQIETVLTAEGVCQ